MAELKREYVIPLRRKTRYAPKWRRSKKAVSVLREYIQKHMKTDHVIIGEELNEHLWGRGARHPPGKVSVIALRREQGSVASTIVNLASVGLDRQLKEYELSATEHKKAGMEAVEEELKAKETDAKEDDKVQEAEVKEVKDEKKSVASKESKTEEKKEAPVKKDAKKKEEKKNE